MAEPLTDATDRAAASAPAGLPARMTAAASPTAGAAGPPGRSAAHQGEPGPRGLPVPPGVAEAIRARADERTAPLVHGLMRPSLALAAGGDGPSAGVLGGLPALPAGTGWPEFAGRPMQLLAQLDCAGLAEAFRTTGRGGDWPLPTAGLLLFFHDEWLSDFTGRGCRVLHVPAGAPPGPAPADGPGTPAVPAVEVRAEWRLSAPSYQDRELENVFPDDFMIALDLAADFRDHLAAPGVRVLGWCDTDTGRPAGHRPLLQIGSRALAVDWGECVNVSFWITDEDLAAGRFDRVRHGFEVA
ncbi:YwqG family protein [Kitasatospora sp. NPDC005748]|uniref:YwqG family protein n=1 Tax=Kitasatospora sp. NPDC005748 TaxID=3157063 RepID=UPI0033D83397